MSNADFSEIKRGLGGRHGSPPDVADQVGSKSSMKEKPAFPSAQGIGKTGPERSAGVKKAKQHPKSIGV